MLHVSTFHGCSTSTLQGSPTPGSLNGCCTLNTINRCMLLLLLLLRLLLLPLYNSCASSSARHRDGGAAVVQSQQQQQHVLFDGLVGVDGCGVSKDVRQGCIKLSQTHRSTCLCGTGQVGEACNLADITQV
jgi:hypothetical protein